MFAPKLKHLLTFDRMVQILPNLVETYFITKSLTLKGLNDLGLNVKVIHNLQSQRSYVNIEQDCPNITKFDPQIVYGKSFIIKAIEKR